MSTFCNHDGKIFLFSINRIIIVKFVLYYFKNDFLFRILRIYINFLINKINLKLN